MLFQENVFFTLVENILELVDKGSPLQLIFDSKVTLNCRFNFYLEYAVKQ